VLFGSLEISWCQSKEYHSLGINFGARQMVDYGFIIGITGHIDRASGRMDVTTVTLDPTKPNDPNIAALRYDVICETNSVF
jgi:hypothetical protein